MTILFFDYIPSNYRLLLAEKMHGFPAARLNSEFHDRRNVLDVSCVTRIKAQ